MRKPSDNENQARRIARSLFLGEDHTQLLDTMRVYSSRWGPEKSGFSLTEDQVVDRILLELHRTRKRAVK